MKSLFRIIVLMLMGMFLFAAVYPQSGWRTQSSSTSNQLIGVSFSDVNNGWAVGGTGTIRRTTNGGTTWTSQTSGTTNALRAVFAINANTVVAVGDDVIRRTTDGGANWSTISSGTTNISLTSISFANSTTGWIVGSSATIKVTGNGGASWGTPTTTASGHLRGVASASSSIVTGVGGTTDNLFQIQIRTTNGGTNWSTEVQGTISGVVYGVSYANSTTGMMAGAGGLVYLTTNAGSGWSSVTSPTSSILYGVAMKDANTAWVVGASGQVYKTTDAGSNWITQSGATSSTLFAVSFSDLYSGTAVGDNGTIIRTTTGGVVSSITASKTGDYTGGSISPGSTGVPLLQVNATNSQGTAYISSLKASFVGTSTAVDADITALKIYNDLDNSGTVSGGDVSLGSTTFSSGTATLSSLSFPVTSSGTKLLFVVDVAPGADPLHTLGITLQSSSFMTAINATSTGFPIGNSSNSPLPIQLASFTAQMNPGGAGVLLQWSTATEINNYGFEIERRSMGEQTWAKIGFVAGSGTSSSPKEYSYLDRHLPSGRYAYRIKQIDNDGTFQYHGNAEVEIGLAEKRFELESNYPNPFNPSTTIRFTLAEDARTRLRVFNVLGEEVATLFDAVAQAGRIHEVKFDASSLPSGVYFSTLESGNQRVVKK